MVKTIFGILVFFFCAHSLPAQNFSGKVTDSQTDKPIAYAHIYALGLNDGAVSDQNGRFKYEPGSELPNRFRITAVGYEEKIVDAVLFSGEELLIHLTPIVIEGGEAVITASALKEARIRNRREWFGRHTFQIQAPPTENVAFGVAQKLDFESGPISPKSFSVWMNISSPPRSSDGDLDYKKADSLKFRLRFVKPDSTGLPSEIDVTGVQIIKEIPAPSGKVTFDLSNYGISIDEKEFYIVLDWLVDDLYRAGEWEIPNYEIRARDGIHYFRYNLFDRWREKRNRLVFDFRFEY